MDDPAKKDRWPGQDLAALGARLTAVEDRLAIFELRAQYCHLIDRQDWDGALDLFTPDCELVGMNTVHGRDALLAHFKGLVPGAMEVSWHRSMTETITLEDGRATGLGQWDAPCVVDGVPMLCAGVYEDEMEKGEDRRWRFARRVIRFHYFKPLAEGWSIEEIAGGLDQKFAAAMDAER